MSGDESRAPPPEDATKVSVVVPVYNAARTIRTCVEAVLAQEYPSAAYEAVFVDNGSTDDSLEILRSFEPDITVCTERRRGPSAARNTGARSTDSEFLAFTDADCVPEPRWLVELVHAAEKSPDVTLVGGPIVAWQPRTPAAVFAERLLDQRRAVHAKRLPYVISANLCVRRRTLIEVGMFDETLITGEDVDLSYRIAGMFGGPFVFAERAVVGHVNPDSLSAIFRKGIVHGRTVGRLADRHAALRGETSLERLLRPRRYLRIATHLVDFSRAAVKHALDGGAESEGEWTAPLYQAAFDSAKQLGLAAHILSSPHRPGSR